MKRLCLDCKYFRQHYVKHKRSYQKIAFGHCVALYIKHKQAGESSCENFQEAK